MHTPRRRSTATPPGLAMTLWPAFAPGWLSSAPAAVGRAETLLGRRIGEAWRWASAPCRAHRRLVCAIDGVGVRDSGKQTLAPPPSSPLQRPLDAVQAIALEGYARLRTTPRCATRTRSSVRRFGANGLAACLLGMVLALSSAAAAPRAWAATTSTAEAGAAATSTAKPARGRAQRATKEGKPQRVIESIIDCRRSDLNIQPLEKDTPSIDLGALGFDLKDFFSEKELFSRRLTEQTESQLELQELEDDEIQYGGRNALGKLLTFGVAVGGVYLIYRGAVMWERWLREEERLAEEEERELTGKFIDPVVPVEELERKSNDDNKAEGEKRKRKKKGKGAQGSSADRTRDDREDDDRGGGDSGVRKPRRPKPSGPPSSPSAGDGGTPSGPDEGLDALDDLLGD
ncbi:hypothetical protein CDCA_CDCA18G4537 [Cyanidium caldarium]|uniref:Transmembrane protein n=1 Tax=Cyanidium caldarium TaxID=2771 RepID=A0AAV9J1N6_CYACA|nr:hypothetical protein CDCA_CDCA18G4537 [Cyanidium caldarium]